MSSHSDLTKQQTFVQRTVEERNIRFVRLWFTDVLGFLKSVAIAPAELENAFAEGIGFDGSAIGTVMSRLNRGRSMLRTLLQDYARERGLIPAGDAS